MMKLLFVGDEIEGFRWKLLAEGKWKGFGIRQKSDTKSRSLLPRPGSRGQEWLDRRGVQGLSWRHASVYTDSGEDHTAPFP